MLSIILPKHTSTLTLNRTLPANLADWLTTDGSLTAMLEARAGQPLIVKRTFEGYRPLSLAQKKQFGLSGVNLNRPVLAWVREVLLYGNSDEPWVQAQSIFPLTSLRGEAKRLQYLQGTPIGYVLFKRQTTLPNSRNICYTPEGWRRQTLYDWHGRKLLIGETFLPAFEQNLSHSMLD